MNRAKLALPLAVWRTVTSGVIALLVAATTLVTVPVACKRQDEPLPSRAAVPPGNGIVTGVVRYSGVVPKAKPIPDADCHLGGRPLEDESVVVDDAGGLRNVIVYIKDGPPVELSSAAVVMDQVNCRFSPHVVAVRTGQVLRFHSSDTVPHNVRAQCEANEPFNFMMAAAGQTQEKTFSRPEFFQVRCDVHPWMNGYVGVFDHPLFAVTGEGGEFRIEHLPAAKYTLVAWQERLGTREQPITVTNEPARVNFEFSPQ